MRFPTAAPRVLVILLLSQALAAPSWAGWSTSPVAIRPTTASIPSVAACNDGAYGTFVAWQEETTPGSGLLRVNHLLATGDPDPVWASNTPLASDGIAVRPVMGMVPDRLGGCYVWWTETDASSTILYVTRLEPNGAVAAGWPTRGMTLGSIGISPQPSVIEDGSHGIYLAWTTTSMVKAHHLGPNGLGAGGWLNTPRVVVPVDLVATIHYWPDLALAPDGGVFLSWGTWSSDTLSVESALYLRRLTPAGLNAPGWPPSMTVGSFRPPEQAVPRAALLDISPDGRGGLFMISGSIVASTCCDAWAEVRLHRLLGDGQPASDWPEGGLLLATGYWYDGRGVPLRVDPDGIDGVIAESQQFYSDSPAIVGVNRYDASGQESYGLQGVAAGHEVAVKNDGGAFVADFKAIGPASQWDWGAFIRVDQSTALPGWSPVQEWHTEPLQHWFGDIALAPTGDGGAVFFWSQNIDRFGLFARRFGPAGEVTGVGSPRKLSALSGLRFVPGQGIAARVELDGSSARLELFDLGGRRLASQTIAGSGAFDVTLPSTASLASGVYFGRLVSGSILAFGKVAVTR